VPGRADTIRRVNDKGLRRVARPTRSQTSRSYPARTGVGGGALLLVGQRPLLALVCRRGESELAVAHCQTVLVALIRKKRQPRARLPKSEWLVASTPPQQIPCSGMIAIGGRSVPLGPASSGVSLLLESGLGPFVAADAFLPRASTRREFRRGPGCRLIGLLRRLPSLASVRVPLQPARLKTCRRASKGNKCCKVVLASCSSKSR
jgi:hypothetical protein